MPSHVDKKRHPKWLFVIFFPNKSFALQQMLMTVFLIEISSLHLSIVELFMFFKDAFFFGIANRKWGYLHGSIN